MVSFERFNSNEALDLIVSKNSRTRFKIGSLGVTVELSVFWGVCVRTHTYTPKYGGPPRQFLKTLKISAGCFFK
jgi:hypothetical protein